VKTSLDHLPHRKQKQLADVTAAVCKAAPVEMVILFGSHARGDWVDDPVGGYFSDFDILIVVKNRSLAEKHAIWDSVYDRMRPRLGETELSLIVHDIRDVNHQLERGLYFFGDVKKEGIVLYDSQRFVLAKERDLTPEERLRQGRVWFADWFGQADAFLGSFEDAFAKSEWKLAAFLLHQATERYYHATLLVFTAYKAKLHNIEVLGKRAQNQHPGFAGVFPRDTKEDDELFKQLKKAYVDARYSSAYHITPEELSILRTRVLDLRERTDRICKERLGLPASPPKELQPTGRALGQAEGKLQGKAEGRAQSVLDNLKLRGIDVPEDVRDRILVCTDLAVLDGWFGRSLSVREARELFDEPGASKA
jgi:predicted nucleotidyltransferase/HEPN domain-containing protein